ncbi:MAG TPA: DUF2062 domain-containing protein [Gammaproteobacteria bacterium]
MPKRIIKRFLPHHDKIREHKNLKILGTLLHDPNLLHLNRRSVSGAFAVGLFIAWIPVPFQMLLSAIIAIFVRVNLPISVALVWLTNPLTMPPLFYLAYSVGSWVLGEEPKNIQFEMSMEWLNQSLHTVWQPFLLGSLIFGVVSSVLGTLAVRALWRLKVVQNWNDRKEKRLAKRLQALSNHTGPKT